MVKILGLCVIVGYLRSSGASFMLLGSIFDRPMFSFVACHVSLVNSMCRKFKSESNNSVHHFKPVSRLILAGRK